MRKPLRRPNPSEAISRFEKPEGRKQETHAVGLARKHLAARLMGRGATLQQVIQALQAAEPGITEYACQGVWQMVMREWRKDYEAESHYYRALQIKRLQEDLAAMRAERVAPKEQLKGRPRPSWSDIARHEMALARITGTNAPVQVQMNHEDLPESLAQVLRDLEPEHMETILASGEEMVSEEDKFLPAR